MSLTPPALLLGVLAFVLWYSRRIPLAGARRTLVVACRALAVAALCASLAGWSRRAVHTQPQRVIYLVDRSASMDEQQSAWIARRIASLELLRPSPVERAVVVFGAEAQVISALSRQPLGSPEQIQSALEAASVTRSRTNLESALLAVAGLLPSGQGGHVILFSDGRETTGNAGGILAHLRRLGINVFPEPVPLFGGVTTSWEHLSVPPVVQRGSPVGAQLVLHSQAVKPQTASVTVSLSGVPVKRQRIVVCPGWQVVTIPVPSIQQGTMALEVGLDIPAEDFHERRAAYTEVEGPPHVLLVADQPTTLPLLASALKQRDIDVSLARPSDLPVQAAALLDYDAVLLFGIPKSSLSPGQVEALQTYLGSFGGGLVMVGLGGNLAEEVSTPAPLDTLLPVTFEPKGLNESHRRIAMVMLLDRSTSMWYQKKGVAAKRAAVEVVKQLSDEDLVGILAFDSVPRVVAEVGPAGQMRSGLIDKLVTIKTVGGTDIYPALVAAADRLELTGSTVKHIILISDGQTPLRDEGELASSRPSNFYITLYEQIAERLRAGNISITVFGIQSWGIWDDFLRWLATETGGQFYHVDRPDVLPQLVTQDTQSAIGRLPFTEGYYRPAPSPASEWFADIPAWPALRGYFTTTAKPGAQLDLTVQAGESPDPLLARWSLGQGRVAVFTSDADTRWSPEWVRWPGFAGWAAQVMRWAMRPRPSEELFAWVEERRGIPHLVLEGSLEDPRAELTSAADAHAVPLSLVQSQPWRWSASLEGLPSGWYALTVESRQEASRSFARRWVQLGTPPLSEEIAGQPPRESLLRQVAHATSGAYGVPDKAFLPPTTSATTQTPLLNWWLPLAIVLLLVEVALRGSSML